MVYLRIENKKSIVQNSSVNCYAAGILFMLCRKACHAEPVEA